MATLRVTREQFEAMQARYNAGLDEVNVDGTSAKVNLAELRRQLADCEIIGETVGTGTSPRGLRFSQFVPPGATGGG